MSLMHRWSLKRMNVVRPLGYIGYMLVIHAVFAFYLTLYDLLQIINNKIKPYEVNMKK